MLSKTAYVFAYMNRVANIANFLNERICNGQGLPNVNEVNGKEEVSSLVAVDLEGESRFTEPSAL